MASQTHTLTESELDTPTPHIVEKAKELPFSKRFLDEDNAASRRMYLKIFGGSIILICIGIFSIMSIYWGSLWKTPVGHLEGWIVVSISKCFNLIADLMLA